MPTEIGKIVQLVCSAGQKSEACRRGICRRNRYCAPPRVAYDRNLFRCRFDSDDLWPRRHAVAKMLAERLIKVGEVGYAARGKPSPFAPEPELDHLDLTRPFDTAALLTAEKEAYEEWRAAAASRSY
jgi:hypothetical protein